MIATAEFNSPDLLQGAAPLGTGEARLDSAVVIRKLEEHVPGLHADLGSRHGLWHPRQREVQGLFYFHRHICSMDRGIMRQWPEWDTKEDLVEVDVDYALLHEDFPVVAMAPGSRDASLQEGQTAYVLRRTLDRVRSVGWAEVFWQLLAKKVPGVTAPWLAATFRVPMDWISGTKISPLSMSFEEGRRRGMVTTF